MPSGELPKRLLSVIESSTVDPNEDVPSQRYSALLDVLESIGTHRDLPELFSDLAQRLHRVVRFDLIMLMLHDQARDAMRLHILETQRMICTPVDFEASLDDSPSGLVWRSQKPLAVLDIERETRFPATMRLLSSHGIASACWLPLSTAQQRVGVLVFGSERRSAYTEGDLEFMNLVGRQVAVAVDNALNFQSAQSYQGQLARERDRLSLLLEVTNAVVSNLELQDLVAATATCLRRAMSHEVASLCIYDPETNTLRFHTLDFSEGKGLPPDMNISIGDSSPTDLAFTSRQPVVLGPDDLGRLPPEIARLLVAEGIQTVCCVPLIAHERTLGTLNVGSRRNVGFEREDLDLLGRVAGQIAIAVENAMAYRQIADLKNKLAQEKLYLEDEIRTQHGFEEVIGDSAALKSVLKQVQTVAPTNSNVLICGETGTGKELIARAIHNLSDRKERTLVKLNCSAIPGGLLESELFGSEKGAFSGAISQRIGRFELAHRGTLFLDEVGDIPLELQPKLLRVLQEQEFERLGSTRTLRVDVRLIAATNQDLSQMVAAKQFRSDLYYRLNVFPIRVPPLRERTGDIPQLVRYFAQKYSRKMNKKIETIPAEALETLAKYPWPGNVRELENFVERAVILSHGPVLQFPLGELKSPLEAAPEGTTTLEAAEREHILRALRETKWVVGGPSGAAARLGVKRTTLQSRMRKLGISRQQ